MGQIYTMNEYIFKLVERALNSNDINEIKSILSEIKSVCKQCWQAHENELNTIIDGLNAALREADEEIKLWKKIYYEEVE